MEHIKAVVAYSVSGRFVSKFFSSIGTRIGLSTLLKHAVGPL